jgi:predicted ATPase
MKIKDLTIKNFKSLVDFELLDAPDVVVLAGPNGTGKSSVLEAIVFFKESIGPYYGWTLPGFVVNTGASFAEISVKFKVFPEEKAYLKAAQGMELSTDTLDGWIKVGKHGNILERRIPQQLAFLMKSYRTKDYPNVGIFDFFNPYRVMGRKQVTTIAVGAFIDQEEKRRRVTFSPSEKFDMTKDYLAQCEMSDIQNVVAKVRKERIRIGLEDVPDSLGLIKKIFNSLLAPKKFIGVDLSESPIRFVVETPQGEIDIDDLSSGEKEILFGFTELLKLHPDNSIILYDEPDLHLNQEVQRKIVPLLREIGKNTQLWTATHSFEVMDSVGYNELFRLENYSGKNQIARVFSDEEKYNTFRSVAGDVGIVTLGQKIVFLEGTEWTDKHILETFFEEVRGKVVFVPSRSVKEVMGIGQKILELLRTSPIFNFYYAIRDRDFMSLPERESIIESGNQRLYVLERYHIENYLIDYEVIYEVLRKNFTPCPCSSQEDVRQKIVHILHEESDRFLSMMVKHEVNKELRQVYFDIGFPKIEEQALEQSNKVRGRLLSLLEDKSIAAIIERKKDVLKDAIDSDKWCKMLPGREILRLFLAKYGHGIAYEQFRNQLVHEIKARDKIPKELKEALSRILEE